MYYEEKVIGGVLFFKTNPEDKWKNFSNTQYTNIILELRKQLQALRDNPDIAEYYKQVQKENKS